MSPESDLFKVILKEKYQLKTQFMHDTLRSLMILNCNVLHASQLSDNNKNDPYCILIHIFMIGDLFNDGENPSTHHLWFET